MVVQRAGPPNLKTICVLIMFCIFSSKHIQNTYSFETFFKTYSKKLICLKEVSVVQRYKKTIMFLTDLWLSAVASQSWVAIGRSPMRQRRASLSYLALSSYQIVHTTRGWPSLLKALQHRPQRACRRTGFGSGSEIDGRTHLLLATTLPRLPHNFGPTSLTWWNTDQAVARQIQRGSLS
eukprot:SAG31_NODE_3065_length_4728_cov_2.260531_2_plen_179_part_00